MGRARRCAAAGAVGFAHLRPNASAFDAEGPCRLVDRADEEQEGVLAVVAGRTRGCAHRDGVGIVDRGAGVGDRRRLRARAILVATPAERLKVTIQATVANLAHRLAVRRHLQVELPRRSPHPA